MGRLGEEQRSIEKIKESAVKRRETWTEEETRKSSINNEQALNCAQKKILKEKGRGGGDRTRSEGSSRRRNKQLRQVTRLVSRGEKEFGERNLEKDLQRRKIASEADPDAGLEREEAFRGKGGDKNQPKLAESMTGPKKNIKGAN